MVRADLTGTITMKQSTFAVAFALSLFLAGAAQAQPVMRDGVLADAAGRTLYIFDKDAPGKSNCGGGCLAAWPAFIAKPEAVAKGEFGLIAETRQWTVNGKPLYYYVGDTKPGDRTGDGQGGVWHVVTGKPVARAQSAVDPNGPGSRY
jgi:predicted lipoprotein with Yx(FWY)xxD motif